MKKTSTNDSIDAESYVESFPELVAALRKEANDHDALSSLKYPVAHLAGELHRIRATSLRSIANRVDKSWNKFRERSKNKRIYDALTTIKLSFEKKLFGKYPSHISDEGIWKLVTETLDYVNSKGRP